MELRVLKYFLAVVNAGTVTKAARVLHVTQPTLSRQLMDLEDELGQKLFVRSNHTITLTQEGILFRRRAEEIMEMVNKTEAEFHSMGASVTGDIYLGCGETNAMKLIAELFNDLHKEYPGVHFHMYSGNAEDVLDRLDKGTLDFGVIIQPVNITKYNSINLPYREVWGLAMRKDNPQAKNKFITKEDLARVPILCSRQLIKTHDALNPYIQWLGQDWNSINVVATYNLIFNAALMVEAGLGCAVAIDKLINTTSVSNLCFRPFKPKLESALNVVWKKDQVFSSAAKLFIAKMQEKFTGQEKNL